MSVADMTFRIPGVSHDEIFGAPETPEDIGTRLRLATRWVRKRTGTVSWKPAQSKGVKAVDVEKGTVFTLAQVWRPDHQAMLRDNRGTKIVVSFRDLRRDWKQVKE